MFTVVILCAATAALGWEYRIAGGATRGRLEVRPSNTSSWGTVCDDAFNATDAIVACRSLALGTDGATSYTAGGGNGTIYMDDVTCRGTEIELAACLYTSQHDCLHREDVGVQCGTTANASSVWEYRFPGGGVRGRLEVRPEGSPTWGSVCADGFTTVDAAVVCVSLGLDSANAKSYVAGDGVGTIYMSEVGCTGRERQLSECPRVSFHSCSHDMDVGVDCGSEKWQYRLGSSGGLEVRPNGNATWGTVCVADFNIADAIVACRSMGLSSYGTYFYVARGGSGPVYMSGLGCTGAESLLSRCTFQSQHSCDHSMDVGVMCGAPWEFRLAEGGKRGRLEVRPNSTAPWGTICDDAFTSMSARVACSSLGLPSSTVAEFFVAGRGTGPIYMSHVRCVGSERTLGQCYYVVPSDCNHDEDVGVQCGGMSAYEYRLSESHRGRLKVRPSSTAPWGTACVRSNNLSPANAQVICRSLGLGGPNPAAQVFVAGGGTGPIYMGDVNCSGAESTLSQCLFETAHTCGHVNDVGVQCEATPAGEAPTPNSPVSMPLYGAVLLTVFVVLAMVGIIIVVVMVVRRWLSAADDPDEVNGVPQQPVFSAADAPRDVNAIVVNVGQPVYPVPLDSNHSRTTN